MNTRRTQSILWLATVGLLTASAAGIVYGVVFPPKTEQRVTNTTPPKDEPADRGTHAADIGYDPATLRQVAGRDFRQRLFDPPVVVPQPPPPKPLPPIELLSTILRSQGEASAWVRDGQAMRKVTAGDTLGPDNNPATVVAIHNDRLILEHEGREAEVVQAAGRGGRP